ncbi:MAG: hypothetical protein R3D98_15385 [Candidatus Krumholzibacteriia bacterium]
MLRFALILALALASTIPAAAGELSDHGPDGIMFQDAGTGLCWLDPAVFLDITRAQAEDFVAASTTWRWATEGEVISLMGSTSAGGIALESIMGARTSTVTPGGPRWTGFFAATTPADGALVQSTNEPDYDTITATGTQGSTGAFAHGAWMVATVDPLIQPRLDHLGSADNPYFHDEETGLYWQDPANFVGQDRAAMQSWLDANTDWRWATFDEVKGLLGKLTVGDVPLVDVLGPEQFLAGPGVWRWLGYCDGIASDAAAVLQVSSSTSLPLITVVDVQNGAAGWNPGAWIVTDVNPTAVEAQSLSGVKAMFTE